VILELGDGREIPLPDSMPDETARQLKRLILTLEERARTAESEVRLLRDEMAALRSQVATVAVKQNDHAPLVDAIGRMHADIKTGLDSVRAAASADRMMVPDEYGEMTRSKVVKNVG